MEGELAVGAGGAHRAVAVQGEYGVGHDLAAPAAPGQGGQDGRGEGDCAACFERGQQVAGARVYAGVLDLRGVACAGVGTPLAAGGRPLVGRGQHGHPALLGLAVHACRKAE